MEALAPFEAAHDPGTPKQIFEENMQILRRAGGMIANLTPLEARSGRWNGLRGKSRSRAGIPVGAHGVEATPIG